MEVKGKSVVVTGGGSGIGEALARRFAAEGARVVVSDINEAGAARVVGEIGGVAVRTDVAREEDVIALVAAAERAHGPIDLFVSNAGIGCPDPGHAASASNEDWQRIWEINVMSHIFAARALLPAMMARKSGAFLITASAAGLLSQIGSAPYAVTKRAAVAFAESLAITHGDDGVEVYCLCPQGVRTPMVGDSGPQHVDGVIEPEEVAECVMQALAEGRFLILPHPTVQTYMERKAGDYQRWIKGMQRFRRQFI
ncbi:MAG: SDR family oxidoreductase [Candidatus Hydrogenedentes bacterium]|nr:SDR family oxidoreductase [Candidatus Hydrogenedentota bacterium]